MAKKYSWLSWGRNYQRLPDLARAKLASMGADSFVVAFAKVLKEQDFVTNRYRHLEIDTPSDISAKETFILPSSTIGRTSYYNAVFEEQPNRRGGKILKWVRGVAPHGRYGGLHRTRRQIPAWPTQLIAPHLTNVTTQRIGGALDPLQIVVRFRVTEVLNAGVPSCNEDLLRCINLLRENVGDYDLYKIDAADADYLRRASEEVGWQFIPDASRDETLGLVIKKLGKRSAAMQRSAQERLDVILSLKPIRLYQGSHGFAGYFAAQFTDTFTVFENIGVDHALFVARTAWQDMSKLTRSQIRLMYGEGANRIVHQSGWKKTLARLVAEARNEIWSE